MISKAQLEKATEGLAVQTLPRWELREPQCRRFESIIMQAAILGTQVIDANNSAEMFGGNKGMTSRTLCARINDSLLGFRRYGYLSKLIPQGFDLRNLTAKEAMGNKVLLINLAMQIKESDAVYEMPNMDNISPEDVVRRIEEFIIQKETGTCKLPWLEFVSSEEQHEVLCAIVENYKPKVEAIRLKDEFTKIQFVPIKERIV